MFFQKKLVAISIIFLFSVSCQSDYKVSVSDEIGGENINVESNVVYHLDPLLKPDTMNIKSNYFYLLSRIEMDDEGNLILADNSNQSIKIYNLQINRITKILGKTGSGPGEFQYINVLRYNPQIGIIVIDNM